MKEYMNDSLPAEQRAALLLKEMSTEEKLYQLTGDMLFNVDEEYEDKRDPLNGSYRNPGHFMHYERENPAEPCEVTRRINRDMEMSIKAQPHGIPPIENGEALHGAQWGMATCFPQPIAMASTFDPALIEEIGAAVGKECAAVGVRQVFAPVVNVVRDCRWGRTVETYGEDVKITSDMGAAYSKGLWSAGVIATPKHFADNYAAGGRDSNYSENSERTLREVFLPPFKACFDAGAKSTMAAYNAWEGVSCSCSPRLLTEILRDEWKFDGFVVSDYSGAEGVYTAHKLFTTEEEAAAACINAGLDVILPYNKIEVLKKAYAQGFIKDNAIDKSVLRILTAKLRLGLFEKPYKDPKNADAIVRNEEHKKLALKAARESLILLKNNGLLPLQKQKIGLLGVCGRSALCFPVGDNYSGPYGRKWTAPDAKTPLEYLQAYLKDAAEVRYFDENADLAGLKECDAVLYFSSILEGEGADRSDLRLPGIRRTKKRTDEAGFIVDDTVQEVTEDQEAKIRAIAAENPNLAVILLNGAPIEMNTWMNDAESIVEAWYPGEQGAQAITELLFGEICPSGKLPITFPRSVGQLPLYYCRKPSGRGYGYVDNDGSPLYPFGYGLSYTSFGFENVRFAIEENSIKITCTVLNTGTYDGAEVLQLYLGGRYCDVVRPVKELKGYARVKVSAGKSADALIRLERDAFCYYDRAMHYGMHNGNYTLTLGTSSENRVASFDLKIREGKMIAD